MWKNSCFHKLASYSPPKWATNLSFVPKDIVKLAMVPTPITSWNIPLLPKEMKLFVKRDDMTGNTLSGNKVRKLEFLLGKALKDECKAIITCGGIQSNHCRATSIAARELGMNSYLFLRSNKLDDTFNNYQGNLFLDLFSGCKVSFIPKKMQYNKGIKQMQEDLANHLWETHKQKAACIPIGGSNLIGFFGYVEAWNEMLKQGICENVDDVVVTCGSGGTVSALSIANYLTGSKLKIHGFPVCDDKNYFYNHIKETLAGLGLNDIHPESIVDIIDGYKGSGYGETTKEDLRFIQTVSASTGIFCDPTYTWKALKGLINEFRNNRERFKGNRILFIHTGGIFSLYDDKMSSFLGNNFADQIF